MTASASLYLIPVPLGSAEDTATTFSSGVIAQVHRIDDFVVENKKTARAILKRFGHPTPLSNIRMTELSEHTPNHAVRPLLDPIQQGRNLGLMSEAGCPAVADPGSLLVEQAHQLGIRVIPLVGPSSLLLALMASGMNGQRFAFHGYLPARDPDRLQALQRLEQQSRRHRSVEIFIETPYRNVAMLDTCLHLGDTTRLCIACDVAQPTEAIRTATIREWRASRPEVSLDRRPAVFLIQAR